MQNDKDRGTKIAIEPNFSPLNSGSKLVDLIKIFLYVKID